MDVVQTYKINHERIKLPHTINNDEGESLTFERIEIRDGKEVLIVTNEVAPGAGPPMHVHWKQDESLTVEEGRHGYQFMGGPKQYAGKGETVTFRAGEAQAFWAESNETLRCSGWVSPPHNLVYFLDHIYRSTRENNGRPDAFESAYLLQKYKSEFDMYGIPGFVKKVIFPVALFFGKLAGKHKRFEDAPPAA